MYEKKDIIFSSTMGLCIVADVTRLSADRKAPVLYYVLRSYYDRNKTAYIPVEDHEVELRDPETSVRAQAYFEELKQKFAENPKYDPDELQLGEAAYVMGMSRPELLELAGYRDDADTMDITGN